MSISQKVRTFASQLRTRGACSRLLKQKIGIWCNGNTTDSGPVFPGSSPGIPTRERLLYEVSFFLSCSFFYNAESAELDVCGFSQLATDE